MNSLLSAMAAIIASTANSELEIDTEIRIKIHIISTINPVQNKSYDSRGLDEPVRT